jgi:transposase
VTPAPDNLPADVDALRAALAAEQLARREAEARASGAEAMVAHLKLVAAKLRHDRFGASSERGRKLLDQMELELEELEAAVSEDAAATEAAADKDSPRGPPRRKPVRAPLPAHLPRERVVIPAPAACPCCGGRLAKLGEDVTETLEVIPRRWKVVQTVREKFTCRACEAITQPPAPFHPIARGRAGPNLLAMVLEAKFGQHLPLNRQSETYAREGIGLGVSTLADWVGTCAATLAPLVALIRDHVMAASRLHGDDTAVPVLARKAGRPPAGSGPMCGTTAPSPGRRRRRRCSTTRATARRSIRGGTWPAMPGCCRRTPMPGSTTSTRLGAGPARSPRPDAGPMAGASCSSWPRSPARRSRRRRCGGSTRSSMPSGPSTGCRPSSAWP